MSSLRVKDFPVLARRNHDISSWEEADITTLSSRGKKRYNKRKPAIEEYFTTDHSIDEITLRHLLSEEILLQLAEKCLMIHKDGTEWGFRALLPGVTVIDYSPQSATEEAIVVENEASRDNNATNGHSREAEQALLDTEFSEEKENTIKRQVTEPSVVPETPSSTSVNDDEEEESPALAVIDDEQMRPAVDIRTAATVPQDVPVLAPSTLVLPAYDRKLRSGPLKKVAQQRRLIRKRWIRDLKEQREHRRFRSIVSLALLAALLIIIVMPAGAGLAAYSAYTNIRDVATDGVNHLLNAKNAIPISKNDPMAALNTEKLQYAQDEFNSANNDLVQLQELVNRPDIQAAIAQFAPEYSGQLGSVKRLVRVALDVSHMGNEMCGIALLGAGIVYGSPLASGSTKPLITAADVSNIEGSLVHALYYIDDIRLQMSQVSLKDLPLSDHQKAQLNSVLALLPQAHDTILQVQGQVSLVAWLLGVGQPRRFLVQTMDRAELRPSGGFTGQYGRLEISNGRMSPFNLRDVAQLDYNGNGMELGRSAPPEYSNWMKFGNWGLRDSNLSADYPTTARMNIQVFQEEGGGPVDGDIEFTPTFIAHILDVTGPIRVAEYNETITAQNLEERLHYYQQDFGAIELQREKTGITNTSARKAFTTLVGKLLLDRVRYLPVKDLLNVVKGAVKDIQSRDLEIYFTNPAAEQWLIDHGYSGAMDTYQKQDGFMVVQANISISKASQYVHTTIHDDVTLDEQGGATHNLTITLDYKQTGPVYGYDTYADYIRVYAPASAQLISGDGFDTGQPLCIVKPPVKKENVWDSPPPTCSPTGSFPSSARYCPDGNYYSLGDRGYKTPWQIDSLGPPTATTSDLRGRAMWGGLTVTPKNCTSYISLSWYVPNAVKKVTGQPPYQLLIQKQGGYIPTVELTIDSSQLGIEGLKSYAFNGDLIADRMFSLDVPK